MTSQPIMTATMLKSGLAPVAAPAVVEIAAAAAAAATALTDTFRVSAKRHYYWVDIYEEKQV
jgi:hypothetical protein